MKRSAHIFTVVVLFFLSAIQLVAQGHDYIKISGNIATVVNSHKDDRLALGASVAWLTRDNFVTGNENNYITLTLSAINNPYDGGGFISSVGNGKDDDFNYLAVLGGYRLTQEGVDYGFYVEPRMGLANNTGGYSVLTFSPIAGYAYRGFDFSVFCDMGFGKDLGPIGKKQFYTVGISFGYNIEL